MIQMPTQSEVVARAERGIAYRRPDSDAPGNRFRLYEVPLPADTMRKLYRNTSDYAERVDKRLKRHRHSLTHHGDTAQRPLFRGGDHIQREAHCGRV